MVSQDVPPYVMVSGNHASPMGLNRLGLQRAGFDSKAMANIKGIYKLLFQSSLSLEDAKAELLKKASEMPEVQIFLSFLDRSTRGLCR